ERLALEGASSEAAQASVLLSPEAAVVFGPLRLPAAARLAHFITQSQIPDRSLSPPACPRPSSRQSAAATSPACVLPASCVLTGGQHGERKCKRDSSRRDPAPMPVRRLRWVWLLSRTAAPHDQHHCLSGRDPGLWAGPGLSASPDPSRPFRCSVGLCLPHHATHFACLGGGALSGFAQAAWSPRSRSVTVPLRRAFRARVGSPRRPLLLAAVRFSDVPDACRCRPHISPCEGAPGAIRDELESVPLNDVPHLGRAVLRPGPALR
ncbi:hypothetical protein BD309DRAFT_1041650, partial [Dichomitus squalens]